MFPAAFISGSRDFMLHFHFRFYARATLDRHPYILVMAWVAGFIPVRG